MLNENTLKLLDIFGKECQGAGYKIFAFSELVALFPEGKYVDEQTIKENVELLAKHGFVSVKHVDQSEVCLSLLDKGRQACQINIQPSNYTTKSQMFNYAFFGAFIGGFTIAIIFIILFLILGGR